MTFSIVTDRDENEEPGFEEPHNADPDHIVNLLAAQSACCTPADMMRFLQRTFRACYRVQQQQNQTEDGEEQQITDYNEDLINKLLYPLDGRPSITPFNPLTRMEKFEQFFREELESARRQLGVRDLRPDRVSDTRIGKAVIGKDGIDIRLPPSSGTSSAAAVVAVPDEQGVNEEEEADASSSRKRERADGEDEEGEGDQEREEGEITTPPIRRLKQEEIVERLEVMSKQNEDHLKASRRRKKDADRVKERTKHLRGQQQQGE